MIPTRLAAHLAVALVATSCRTSTPGALDPAMASCVPANASILAGVNVTQLRAAASYSKLPAAARAFIDPLHPASYALFASDGVNMIAISRGPFRETPPGAMLLASGLAIGGSPQLLQAAAAQHRAGNIAARDLLTQAGPLAATHQVWMVLRGSATLPLTGNAVNVNRLLRATSYTTMSLDMRDPLVLEITGICRTLDGGRDFEQSLRAMLSLAAGANARQPDLAALLNSIQIRREDQTVRVTLSAKADALDQVLRAF